VDQKNEPEDDVVPPFYQDVTAGTLREDEPIVVLEDSNQHELPIGWAELWSDDNVPY
jgi:hypothetical protein